MPRGSSVTVENNFTQGLVTELSAMNFPENAVTEGDNCIFSELGSVTRRKGMNAENDYTTHTLSSLSSHPNSFTEFKWYSAGNSGTTTFLVQQVGDILHFFSSAEGAALSPNKKTFTVDLSDFKVAGATADEVGSFPCQFTFGKGYLIVVNPLCDPFYVSYDDDTDTISTTEITIKIRDFDGVEDNLEVDERPSTLSTLHKYNLYNQGWYTSAIVAGDENPRQVVTAWHSIRSDYPSNADIWWAYKSSTGVARFNIEYDRDGPSNPSTVILGNTPAPKGHYIYNAFNIDRTAETGIAELPTDSAGNARPTAVAFYAGRVFYAGVQKNRYSGKIYFSQIVESDRQIGLCYQQNDPTSEVTFDLLESDGGVISLPLVDTVIALKVVNDTLVVVARNGIVTISGSDSGPFKANNYKIDYTSTIGSTSTLSMIEVDGGLMYWNNDVIYALLRDRVTASFGVQNISKATIQTILSAIPADNLPYIKGAYNKKDQIIQWIYSDDENFSGYRYNRILEFNVVSKAFYTHTIDISLGPRICGIVTIAGVGQVATLEDVQDGGVDVTDSAVTVQTEVFTYVPTTEQFKYLILTANISSGTASLTYGSLRDEDYLDWVFFDTIGVPYTSYGVSGYRIRGSFQQSFNSTPITFVAKYFEDGRMKVSGIWDYGFRTTSEQELYLVRPEVDFLIRRVKLRGKGKSLQIKFQSVGNAPFELIGWSTFDSGGTVP